MAFVLGNQDKLALMMTLFGSQRKLAESLGVTHQRVGRWLREGQGDKVDPETGEILKGRGVKKIPDAASHPINDLFQIYKQICREQAKADKLFYDSRVPVFLQRPLMNNGARGMRVYAEHTQYTRQVVRTNFFALVQRTKQFIQASVRSEINIFSYIGATPKESAKKRAKRYSKADFQKPAEAVIDAGGRLMPVFTKYENISPGTGTVLSIRNIEAKVERHAVHATKSADMWLFQLKTPLKPNETPKTPTKRTAPKRAKRR